MPSGDQSAGGGMTISIIAAVARNGVIGHAGALRWQLPEDQKFFRRVTMGCPVIMGRKTWESLPDRFRPLSGRRNIVVSRNPSIVATGAEVVPSLAAAIKLTHTAARVFVIGGGELYRHALPLADELVLTEIDRDFEGDVLFPAWDRGAFREVSRESHHATAPIEFDYDFVTYQRNRP